MQTSLARRQRHRRQANANRPKGGGAVKATAIALPLFLFTTLLLLGLIGFTSAVTAYSFFSRDLPEPQAALDNLKFSQQTRVYDRTGTIELAKLGDDRREVVTFADIPGELIDATTSIEDKTYWENAGFDPAGFVSAAIDTLQGDQRGGSTITQQLVRARLLPASAFEGSVYERKIKEIIQSIRLTEAYPGDEGKRQIITAYLNQNFYGNRSYGVRAAARSYFGKELADLTLAEMALLAAIPQSPTKFDLVKNAVEEEYTDEAGEPRIRLVVPATTEVVIRRNFILDLMKEPERSVLTRDRHTLSEYDAAKREPVILASQANAVWRAPHFVWQVREALGEWRCGEGGAAECEEIDTGGYTVITSLDWTMQKAVEKWVFVAARGPNSKNPAAVYKARKIPARFYDSSGDWLSQLRGRNIHNAASAVVDYRTGEVLAYAGSASYTATGTKKFQPQFDVLEDGWRQPGSSIKPLDYLIGIEDRTMTAATMFMDVVTNFAPSGADPFTPTQADKLERGPVRLRSALQFSLNIPAIKAGFINGLDHQLERTKDLGLRYAPGAIPVISESIGTLETHPIDMVSGYGAIANGGVLMPRQLILEIRDDTGKVVYPTSSTGPAGDRVASEEASFIITDILAGNTIPEVNPYWAEWRPRDGLAANAKTRPAAYKTGTTSDNRDVHAYGYLAPPSDPDLPALVVGVWMGNSNNEPNKGSLSLDSSAPLWSAIMSEVSQDLPIEGFARVRPDTLVEAEVDAFTGMKPGAGTNRTVTELFIKGTVPRESASWYTVLDIDAASGRLWRDGCVGPRVAATFVDYAQAEANYPASVRRQIRIANVGWMKRAPGRRAGGPEGTRPTVFYNNSFAPFGKTWGGKFPPSTECPLAPAEPTPCVEIDPLSPCPSLPPPSEEPSPTESAAAVVPAEDIARIESGVIVPTPGPSPPPAP